MSKNTNPVKIQNTIRDTNQSNFAGVLSAKQMTEAENHAGEVGYSSIQAGGGTFFAVPVTEGRDPWDEFKIMREAYPDTPLSILVRGDTLVGYDDNPNDVIEAYIKQSAEAGVDIFTIFDGFNDTRKQAKVIEEVKKNGKHAQGVICVSDSEVYTMELYKKSAQELYDAGADSFYIKDPVGVTSPDDIRELVSWLKDEFPDKEVQIHTHNTHGMAYPIYMAAIEAGVDTIDCGNPASAENVGQPSVLRMVDLIENHPNPDVAARAPDLDMGKIGCDLEDLYALRFQYRDFTPKFDKNIFDAMYAAKAPGGASSTLKSMVHSNTSGMLGLDWDDAQVGIYRVQEKLIPLIGSPLQVTPHAKNTTSQAVFALLHFAGHGEYGEKIRDLKQGSNASGNVLEFINNVLDSKEEVIVEGRGAMLEGDAFMLDAMQSKITVDIAKMLAGRLGNAPGVAGDDLMSNPKVVEQILPEDKRDIRPSDLLDPGMEAARASIVAAGFGDPELNDVVTVALLSSKGLDHVNKKLGGELVSSPVPNMPKYAQDISGGDIVIRNGVKMKGEHDVFVAMGGAAVIESVAQDVVELEKKGHYKTVSNNGANAASDNFYSDIYKEWHATAKGDVDEYVNDLPQILYDAGFEPVQLVSAIGIAEDILKDACVNKGVSFENIPVIEYSLSDIDCHRGSISRENKLPDLVYSKNPNPSASFAEVVLSRKVKVPMVLPEPKGITSEPREGVYKDQSSVDSLGIEVG